MKIFDCFMYFDEDQVLDLRLNILYQKVDYFVIVESTYNHKGEEKKLLFDINKFSKFKDKIIYLVYNKIPANVKEFEGNETLEQKKTKYMFNAIYRENSQRNYISNGLNHSDENDIILISDIDEIPKLDAVNFKGIGNEILIFMQDMFHYKFNLVIPNFKWHGTKATKKKI